jgi:hypothetical protein
MKIYGVVDIHIHVLFNVTLVEGEWLVSRIGRFNPGPRSLSIHWIGAAKLNDVKKREFLATP